MFDHLRLLSVLVLAVGCNQSVVESKVPVRKVPVRAQSLHIDCRGHGRPPVVLDAGLGNDSSVWSSVLPEIAKTTQVCAYDRAGMGASSAPARRPHSNQLMAEELHELLRASRVPEPYVLVGHSMGGANMRYLAAKSPKAVVGMVLVDSVSADQPSRYWALLPEENVAEFKEGLKKLPEGIDFDTFRDGLERLRTVSPSLGELPLVVLARGKALPPPPGASPELGRELDAVWRSLQDDLPRLSSNSAYVIVEDAGHYIQLDRPDVVIAAVNEIVDSVRHRRPVERGAISVAVDE